MTSVLSCFWRQYFVYMVVCYCRRLQSTRSTADLKMSNQINVSQSFKRFVNASTSEIIKIREGRREEKTKKSTK